MGSGIGCGEFSTDEAMRKSEVFRCLQFCLKRISRRKFSQLVVFFGLIFALIPTATCAEMENIHGQIGGSFDFDINSKLKSSVGYYVENGSQIEVIKNWFAAPHNIEKIQLTVEIYDLFIIVVHSNSFSGGKINSKYIGAFSKDQIDEMNNRLDSISIAEDHCLMVPISIGKNSVKINILQFFVHSNNNEKDVSTRSIEECLNSGFNLVWKG